MYYINCPCNNTSPHTLCTILIDPSSSQYKKKKRFVLEQYLNQQDSPQKHHNNHFRLLNSRTSDPNLFPVLYKQQSCRWFSTLNIVTTLQYYIYMCLLSQLHQVLNAEQEGKHKTSQLFNFCWSCTVQLAREIQQCLDVL